LAGYNVCTSTTPDTALIAPAILKRPEAHFQLGFGFERLSPLLSAAGGPHRRIAAQYGHGAEKRSIFRQKAANDPVCTVRRTPKAGRLRIERRKPMSGSTS
jgi:hypothetical protein